MSNYTHLERLEQRSEGSGGMSEFAVTPTQKCISAECDRVMDSYLSFLNPGDMY